LAHVAEIASLCLPESVFGIGASKNFVPLIALGWNFTAAGPKFFPCQTPFLPFDNTYARDLPGFYEPWQPERALTPVLLFFNRGLAEELRLGLDGQDDTALANLFPATPCPRAPSPSPRPTPGTSSASSTPSLGTAGRC
jgi:hypothetical protein